MRVKLSYTVEEDKVLAEASKLVGLCADDMQYIVQLFNDVQREMRGDEEVVGEAPVNTHRVVEMLEDFRTQLSNIDTRLFEVLEVVNGYQKYLQNKKEEERLGAIMPPPPADRALSTNE
jgi:hypothetical protein